MTIFQTLSSESNSHRCIFLEWFDLFFNNLSNSLYSGNFFVFKLTDNFIHGFIRVFNTLFQELSIELVEIIIQPAFVGLPPKISCCPQVVEGLKFLDGQVYVIVICFIVSSQCFTIVIHLGVFRRPRQFTPYFFSILRNLLIGIYVLVLSKAGNLASNIVNF